MRTITILFLSILTGLTAWADIPIGYYRNAIDKQDEALMTALEGIINAHTELSYNYLWDAYLNTDMGSDGYYIDMYSDCKYNHSTTHVGNATYVGQGLNREHSFPKSWFGGEIAPMFTDLTMIIPTDAYVNQRRGNNPYGMCANGITYTYTDPDTEETWTMKGKLGKSTYDGFTATVFEPDDEYKGDFARIYFYMVTCYKSQVEIWPGSGQLDYESNGYKAFSDWSIQMLMEWHRADPVSQKEIIRNEAVYKEQGNRNPFVDHPELAEHIWGIKQNIAWTGEGTPLDDIIKNQPVMLDVDTAAVTGTSFRADWTNGGDVSSYTLQVNRIETGEDSPVLLLAEGFSKVTANSDGRDDIGASLDNYTDNPGWTGSKLYTAANTGLKFGTSSAAGYIISPELVLASTISVKFNAKNWINSKGVSDRSSVIVSCGDVSQTIALSDSTTEYSIVLTDCSDTNVKLSGTTGNKRFYVYDVEIYNGNLNAKAPRRDVVEEGDSTMRTVSGITDTCYTVQALAGGTFKYLVKAIYIDGSESAWSNIKYVTLTGETDDDWLFGDMNGDREVNISDVIVLINYILNDSSDTLVIEHSDMNGDRETNISDVIELINIILNHI